MAKASLRYSYTQVIFPSVMVRYPSQIAVSEGRRGAESTFRPLASCRAASYCEWLRALLSADDVASSGLIVGATPCENCSDRIEDLKVNERKIAFYYAWSRPKEVGAPLVCLENRFPALFESRRLLWPRLDDYADAERFDQGIGGFLDHVLTANFNAFLDEAERLTGSPVLQIERSNAKGQETRLNEALLDEIDTLIVISFDSKPTEQQVSVRETAAVRAFLDHPDHMVFVCPHHDVGAVGLVSHTEQLRIQEVQFLHHGDRTIPPQQQFGGFGRSLLAGLGVPVENRFGLRPAAGLDGEPAPLDIDRTRDRFGLLKGVTTFNLHPHLPHYERIGESQSKLEVLARQFIDLQAPSHPFVDQGNTTFDALLQSGSGVFAGQLFVCDATLWMGVAGGLDSLRRLWSNIVRRPTRDANAIT